MTRNTLLTSLTVLGLTFGAAGTAMAKNDGNGTIIAPMGPTYAASQSAGIGETSQGKTQLASQLKPLGVNVDPTHYTVNQLQNMLSAARNGDVAKLNFYKARVDQQPSGGVNQGTAQLAAQLGLNPADYSGVQLARIANDVRNGDLGDAAYVAKQGNSAPQDGVFFFLPSAR